MSPDVPPSGHRYGICEAQYRTDVPSAGPSSQLPQARVNPLGVALVAGVAGVALLWSALTSPVTPLPAPASNEAALERQVEALSTHVVELEWRNAATLESLDSFERPTPTPIYVYVGPGEQGKR